MATNREIQIEDELRYLAWKRQMCDRQAEPGARRAGELPAGSSAAVRVPAEAKRLYHLVPASEAEAVVRDGIFADGEGCIYCFTERSAAEVIAREQVFARRYAVFEIEVGALAAEVEADVRVWVWEPYQRVVRQASVAPQFLTLVGVYEIARPPTEQDYTRCGRWGWSRERTDAVFSISDRFAAGELNVTQVADALRRVRERHGPRSTRSGSSLTAPIPA